jgi:hypothetical protein
MTMLSPEVNRFLGRALLDPEMAKHIFNNERQVALKDFNLLPEERATILASKAQTLAELSHELLAALAVPAPADVDAEVETLQQSLRIPGRPISIRRVQAMAQRAATATAIATARHSAVVDEPDYAQLKSA